MRSSFEAKLAELCLFWRYLNDGISSNKIKIERIKNRQNQVPEFADGYKFRFFSWKKPGQYCTHYTFHNYIHYYTPSKFTTHYTHYSLQILHTSKCVTHCKYFTHYTHYFTLPNITPHCKFLHTSHYTYYTLNTLQLNITH